MRERLMEELETKKSALYKEIMEEMSDMELYRWQRVINQSYFEESKAFPCLDDVERAKHTYLALGIDYALDMLLDDDIARKVLKYNVYDNFYDLLDMHEDAKVECENGEDLMGSSYSIIKVILKDGSYYTYSGGQTLTKYDKDGHILKYSV